MSNADLVSTIAHILDPWAFDTKSYNATIARDDATDKATQIVEALAALDSRAGDAALIAHAYRVGFNDGEDGDFNPDACAARMGLSATPAPAVDAVPAGEVERLARIRTSMALLQQNSEGCALNHYGDDATLHGMPGWLIDTKTDLDAFTEILARREADRG